MATGKGLRHLFSYTGSLCLPRVRPLQTRSLAARGLQVRPRLNAPCPAPARHSGSARARARQKLVPHRLACATNA